MKKNIISIIGGILVIASFVFIAQRFSTVDANWYDLLNPTMLSLLIVLPFLSVTIIFIQSYCWKRLLTLFTDQTVHCGDTFSAYAKANLAKYMPGNIGHYAARQMYGAQIGLRQLHLGLASLLEIAYCALSLLTLSLLFSADAVLAALQRQFGDNLFVLLGTLAITVIVLLTITGFIFRKSKHVTEIVALVTKPRFWFVLLGSLILFAASSLIGGFMFVSIFGQYVTLDFQDAFILIGGSITCHFIGFVTPGAPGGIGVREAAMLFLLSPYFPSEIILLVAIAQRVIMIIGDVIVFPISLLFRTTTIKGTIS